MQRISLLAALIAAGSQLSMAGTLFLPAYPAAVLVFDEEKEKIVDRIPLSTGTPMSIRLSPDHKRIYLTTIDHNGIEVLDVATRKIVNHFALDTPTKQYRMYSGTADPEGKFYYAVTKEITRMPEHFDVAKIKFCVIDLEQQTIVKTVDIPKEEEEQNQGDFGMGALEMSPDGKYLYQFGHRITIFQASDFKVIDHLELEQPESPGMSGIRFGNFFGNDLDLINEPGAHTGIFLSEDPIVHNHIFGLARMDLSSRRIDFTPVGPAPMGMSGIEVTPDKKSAFTVIAQGMHGTKRCEFWSLDLNTNRIAQKADVPCRTRFTLGISTNGKKLYIYGAGFDIEVYDAATLKYEKTWDLNTDVTYAGIVELP